MRREDRMLGRRVLVVEPDVVLAATYVAALAAHGWQAAAASTAQDAILAADAAIPDVVVLELQLTAHSGVEFLYEFRSYVDWQAVPVVVHSHVPVGEFARSRELLERGLGVVAYQYKPRTSLQELLGAVEAAVSGLRAGSAGTGVPA